MSEFLRSTAVQQVDDSRWAGEVVPGWRIGKVPCGGYVLAIAGRVLSEALPHPDPLTVSILYTAPTIIGPHECEVQTLRSGGSTTHARLEMRQEGKIRAHVQAAYTNLDEVKGDSWSSVTRPEISSWREVPATKEHGIE